MYPHYTQVKPGESATIAALEPTTVTLLMALLYALDVSSLQKVNLSCILTRLSHFHQSV